MQGNFCDILCVACGKLYTNLYFPEELYTDTAQSTQTRRQYFNYLCLKKNTFTPLLRTLKGLGQGQQSSVESVIDLDDILQEIQIQDSIPLNECLACNQKVEHFGDRYHEELGFILEKTLSKPCPRCGKEHTLYLLERSERWKTAR